MLAPVQTRAAPAQVSRRRAWLAAFLLMVAYALSWTDRNLPAVLLEPMRASLRASDTQLALLTGFAFAICHATLAVPAGWLSDKWNRRHLIMAGVFTWSLLTAACGFAPNFPLLFLCRMGVGLGEAMLLPAAYALLADLFSRDERPKALMVLVLGTPIGSALAFAGGGTLHAYVAAESPAWAMGLQPWRATFLVVGVLGLFIAGLMALLPEPRRRALPPVLTRAAAEPQIGGVGLLDYFRAAAFFLVPFVIGVTLFNMFVNGFIAWLVPMFVRTYDWSLAAAGSAIGSALLLTGLAGGPLGALLSRLIGRRRGEDASIIVLILSATGLLVFAVLSPLAADGRIALGGVVVALGFAMFAMVVAPASILNSAPAGMRARVAAIYLLIANLVGSSAGPALYALSTDYVFRDSGRLYLSMSLVSAVLLLGAIMFLVTAQRLYGRVMRLADSFEGQNSA